MFVFLLLQRIFYIITVITCFNISLERNCIMKNSLFVGGLDFSITSENLAELFSQYGTVASAKVVTDMYSGRSKGFGFVDMSSAEEAAKCIAALNNSTHKNRQITVREKEDKPRRAPGSGGGFDRDSRGGNGGGNRNPHNRW